MKRYNFLILNTFYYLPKKFYSTQIEPKIFSEKIFQTNANNRNLEANPLMDKFNRKHTYLRISLTEKCNLRCTYCMPEEGVPQTPPTHLLTTDEIIRLAKLFAINGVEKIRLTGGEPTLRKDLVEIVDELNKIQGINEIGITTNGITLTRNLEALIAAGLAQVNISLDTLNENKYAIITRRNGFQKVIKCIEKAEKLMKNRIKLNCVVIRGMNDYEVPDFVALTKNQNIDIRFIEYMPFGGNKFAMSKMVPYKEMLKKIEEKFPEILRLNDPKNSTTKAYKIDKFKGQFGFISSMSEHFCATCNRVRLTADGNLKVCLHGNAEISLRDQLRSGYSDAELLRSISQAIKRKKAQHAENFLKEFKISNLFIKNFLNTETCRLYSYYNNILINHVNYIQITNKRNYSTNSKFTHLNSNGKASMVDISNKQLTIRIAMAKAIVQLSPETYSILLNLRYCAKQEAENYKHLEKGDAFAVARLAGIMAAKKTADLVMLCHNIPISHVEIRFQENRVKNQLIIYCRIKSCYSTGVEMEALTGCTIAALNIYDMCKALKQKITIEKIELLGKFGGKEDFGVVQFSNIFQKNNEFF